MRGFTPRQRLVLALMATMVVAVFGLLAYSVLATMRQISAHSGPSATAPAPVPSPTNLVTTTAVSTPSQVPTVETARPSPAATVTRSAPLSQIQSARAVQEVGQIVAGLRGLPPLEQLAVTFPTQHEMAVFLLQRYQEQRPQEALVLYAALGLVPRLEPLPLPDVTGQAAQISSMYLPAGQQVLVVGGRGPANPDDELALVHSVAHAVADGQFDLGNLAPCRPTVDATLALWALVEGDAVLTTARYAEVEGDSQALERLAQQAANAEQPTFAPLTGALPFELLRLFPYQRGLQLVSRLYAQGGWETVNRVYAYPPCSTEQVLHPERYLSREPVQEVVLPDLGPSLGAGWSLLRQETVGEFLVGLHLAAYLDDDELAWEAAEGWAGDRLILWEDGPGRQLLAWRIAWDDRNQAQSFEQAYALLVPRFRVPPVIASSTPFDLPGRFWQGPAGAAYLVRVGRMVTVVWGPDAETVTAVAQVLP